MELSDAGHRVHRTVADHTYYSARPPSNNMVTLELIWRDNKAGDARADVARQQGMHHTGTGTKVSLKENLRTQMAILIVQELN